MIAHELRGCAPTPLAHYLKALGVLRLVAEQADPQARGWWEGERFFLASHLDIDALEAFFLNDYKPSPLVAPWNGASGFYPKDKKARKAHDALLAPGNAKRFSDYRAIIVSARSLVGARKEAPKDDEKSGFIQACRRVWRENALAMLEAALVLDENGKVRFPALLGTGWNDGKFDFTSNFLIRLLSVVSADGLPTKQSQTLLWNALWDATVAGLLTGAEGKVGQFLPGGAGGANSVNSPGDQNDTLLNPWDFVLMLEGVVLFVAHASRRLGSKTASRASAPFAVSAHGAGYASSSDEDESARGEQWMPLWSQPLTLLELRRLLAEGKAQLGAHDAQEPLDLARAIARLGTARGITAFQRYGYIERNGQANFAVPLGRIYIPERAEIRVAILDDLEAWLPRLRQQARDTKTAKAPASLKHAEHRLADDLFAAVQHPDEPARWQSVLASLAGVEGILRTGSGMRAGPIPRLRPEWVAAADDGSPEFRLALAFALQAAGFSNEGRAFQPVRRHWLSLDGARFAITGTGSQQRLRVGPEVVMQGRDGEDDAIALVGRCLIEAAQKGQRRLPLQAAPRASASVSDLAALTAGHVNLDRALSLARALMALNVAAWFASSVRPRSAPRGEWPDDAWIAIRLALLPWPLQDGRRIGADPAIVRRLATGDAASAVELALRRLRAAGIRTTLRAATADPATARRWAAALAFPVTQSTASSLLERIQLTTQEHRNEH